MELITFLLNSILLGVALAAACIIGAVTYIICRIGLGLGVKVGTRYNRQAAILGGVILIAIAIEILLKHLLG